MMQLKNVIICSAILYVAAQAAPTPPPGRVFNVYKEYMDEVLEQVERGYHKPINLLPDACNFSTTPTTTNLSLSTIEGHWFLSYSKEYSSELSMTAYERKNLKTRIGVYVDQPSAPHSEIAEFHFCFAVETLFGEKDICIKENVTESSGGILNFPLHRVLAPIFNLTVPGRRFDGLQMIILAVDEEFFVVKNCLIFDGECPEQGLSFHVYSRSKE